MTEIERLSISSGFRSKIKVNSCKRLTSLNGIEFSFKLVAGGSIQSWVNNLILLSCHGDLYGEKAIQKEAACRRNNQVLRDLVLSGYRNEICLTWKFVNLKELLPPSTANTYPYSFGRTTVVISQDGNEGCGNSSSFGCE